jgi:hypothetical protein
MSVSFGDRTVGRLVTNIPTARSPKETDIEPDVVDMQKSPEDGRKSARNM